MKDLKIINAKIPFFETNEWEFADILIDGGKIIKIGTVLEETREVIDAAGQVVSPGFIDIHAHEDPLKAGPYDYFTALCELRMGVTTKVAGNCGENHNDLGEFCASIAAKGSPTNYMMFVGQSYLRQQVGASDRYRPSTKAQIDAMKLKLAEAAQYGPVGLSCGFEYEPGITTDETVDLLKAFDDEGYLVSVHFRADGAASVTSIDELVEIYRRTGYGIQMSHIGSCSAVGYMAEALAHINQSRNEGVDISTDCYPYHAFCTGIGTAVFDDGCFQKWGKGYDALLVTGGKYKNHRCTKEIFEELRREDPEVYVAAFVMNEEEIDLAYREPFVMVGSDSGFVQGCGHPRGAGTFPRVLGHYVRERKTMSLMDALRKMTILPSDRLNLRTKGEIKEGFDADIVIFDAERILDKADFEQPTLPPEGIAYVLVDGQIAVKGKAVVNGTLGRYIPYQNRV
ncbi:N-acyl-D-amino-acid deacylase family protein [Emergencia timonensis]|uniref:N-acyl-D-amino-acid deacylase family protein n=1 Tax=Emergencia timonensis TaxID=1776384 RepID=UPI0039969612